MEPWILILVIMGVTVIGGGGAFILWWWTQPKKQSWNAKVWQLSEGIRPPIRDNKGNIISELKKKDMKPLGLDILQRTDISPGVTRFELLKMGKPTPAVTNDVVDYWGPKSKEVNCLLNGDSVTLLKKGYDAQSGEILFDPMPYDRKMMLATEMTMRKERLENKKAMA